ncbi:4-oxalomesaconate tautomerase [Pelagibius marinus]|uniref:4-oxalomesaconate tautomerase n=1 Tax=Pelagibius marinus TaxID=2762760 RepID=UPI001872E432|nr:4-oxalomesaconate tautomerase [Pelagibius marinus]
MMRGGTSKGAYFLASDLPQDAAARDALLLSVMGSPDPRQIDGIGGADPLTSKVAIVERSARPGIDVDYLFAQVFVDEARVGYAQNCGNILAGVGYFAIEQGLVPAGDPVTHVTIYMSNSGQTAVAEIATPGGKPSYRGEAHIDGVPGSAAPVPLSFTDAAGSTCGALLPTGNAVDEVAGTKVTLIDNGMPVVVMLASDMGISGEETREELDANSELKARLEKIRLAAGPLMNLGDVTEKTIPKMTMVSAPRHGGCDSPRTFIPHRCHATIGVFGAISVATACLLPDSPAAGVAVIPEGATKKLAVEHPTGALDVLMEIDEGGSPPEIKRAAFLRTARKLFVGSVFPHEDG